MPYDRNSRPSLIIRNLPLDTRKSEVEDLFRPFGPVRDVYLPLNHYTRRFQGFGFVEFYDIRDAEDAQAELDSQRFGGRTLEVSWSRDDRKTPREMLRRDQNARGVYGGPGGGGGDYDRGRDRYGRGANRAGGGGGYYRPHSRPRSPSPRRERDCSPPAWASRGSYDRSPAPRRSPSPHSPAAQNGRPSTPSRDAGSRSPPPRSRDSGARSPSRGEESP